MKHNSWFWDHICAFVFLPFLPLQRSCLLHPSDQCYILGKTTARTRQPGWQSVKRLIIKCQHRPWSWCLLAMNRAVHSLLFQTNCRKKGVTHHQNKIPGHLHNPSRGRVTEVRKNKKNMALDNFGWKKKTKWSGKTGSVGEFKLHLNCREQSREVE